MPITKSFDCPNLFATQLATPRNVHFLDWACTPLPSSKMTTHGIREIDLEGAGIYGLFFRDDPKQNHWNLIYIGSYLGSKNANPPFGGNVVRNRWWTHISSITMRGHRVSITAGKLKTISDRLFPGGRGAAMSCSMLGPLLKAPASIGADQGCVTSVNRATFAHDKRKLFQGVAPASILPRFRFLYSRIFTKDVGTLSSIQVDTARALIRLHEKKLIGELQPPCNKIKSPNHTIDWNTTKSRLEVSVSDIEKRVFS